MFDQGQEVFTYKMKQLLDRMERKLGGRAVPHLTAVMIGCFIVGYVLKMMNPNAASYMNLDIYKVLHGEVWRLITWIIIPPSGLDFFTVIMLFFYLSIGRTLERAWGDFRYNIYVFGGILISIAAAFISYFIFDIHYLGAVTGEFTGAYFTTYNICMSLLLAFAATFPDATVLLMFVIPVKMKYIGIMYGAYVAYDVIQIIRTARATFSIYYIGAIAIGAAMLNFLIFFLISRGHFDVSRQQRKRQREFRKAFENGRSGEHTRIRNKDVVVDISPVRHRCEVCGRTEKTDPDLEFRYCSKCQGDHEYCMDHLYTHQHITL